MEIVEELNEIIEDSNEGLDDSSEFSETNQIVQDSYEEIVEDILMKALMIHPNLAKQAKLLKIHMKRLLQILMKALMIHPNLAKQTKLSTKVVMISCGKAFVCQPHFFFFWPPYPTNEITSRTRWRWRGRSKQHLLCYSSSNDKVSPNLIKMSTTNVNVPVLSNSLAKHRQLPPHSKPVDNFENVRNQSWNGCEQDFRINRIKKAGKREHHLWKKRDSAGSGQKALNLVRIISGVPHEKEAIYKALDKWTAWEVEFPMIAAAKALIILRKRSQWRRLIECILPNAQVSKWMLSKGQGTTMATYDSLLLAFDMDHRVFGDMEELHVRPDDDTVRRVARAFRELGEEDKRKLFLQRYQGKWKYMHFKGERVRVKRQTWDENI
ncbi:hypothetical protein ACFE04_012158 [Oxalis oulophora]